MTRPLSLTKVLEPIGIILFIIVQIYYFLKIKNKLSFRIKNSFLSYLSAFIVSEFIMFIVSYAIILLSGGHIFPKISIIQAGLYYLAGFSIWNESPLTL